MNDENEQGIMERIMELEADAEQLRKDFDEMKGLVFGVPVITISIIVIILVVILSGVRL